MISEEEKIEVVDYWPKVPYGKFDLSVKHLTSTLQVQSGVLLENLHWQPLLGVL
jgi:hypothetical protein